MNAKLLLSIATLAAAMTGVARADEADGSQYGQFIEGQRTRAEVMAEAAIVSARRSTEPGGSRVIATPASGLEVKEVRETAASALRLGQISAGEVGRL